LVHYLAATRIEHLTDAILLKHFKP